MLGIRYEVEGLKIEMEMKFIQYINKLLKPERRLLVSSLKTRRLSISSPSYGFKSVGVLFISLVMFAFTSCDVINDDLEPCKPNKEAQELYLCLTVTTPNEAVTRSFTTSEGNASNSNDKADDRLEGNESENELKSATIYLVDNDYNIQFQLETEDFGTLDNGNRQLKARIDNLEELIKLAGKSYKILIVGNASETGLRHNFDKDLTKDAQEANFSVSSLITSPIGKFGTSGKMMPFVNADGNVTIAIPDASAGKDVLKAIQDKFESNGQGEAIWDVNSDNAISLERAVARLEYKDAVRTSENLKNYAENIYPVSTTKDARIKLYSLQPFNVNKDCYLFRHTALGTTVNNVSSANEKATIFGVEKGNASDKYNWVAGKDWTLSSKTYTKTNNYLNVLTLNSDESGYEIKNESSVTTDGLLLISEVEEAINAQNDGYHPFYYVTENTLPSTSLMSDEKLISNATGVAFTFVVLDRENKPLQYNSDKYPESIKKSDDSDKSIIITDNDGNWIKIAPNKDGLYYITYIGFIAHNNDKTYSDGNIPPMKYGVVRNNTYQLSVNSINSLPLPNEPESYYLSLDIKVLSWTKRDIVVTW